MEISLHERELIQMGFEEGRKYALIKAAVEAGEKEGKRQWEERNNE